jgi:hypothetical protein
MKRWREKGGKKKRVVLGGFHKELEKILEKRKRKCRKLFRIFSSKRGKIK